MTPSTSPYRFESIVGGVAIYWHSAPSRISDALCIVATHAEAARWARAAR